MKPESHLSLWPACLDVLAQELPEQQFNTWIKPLSAQASADGSRVTLLIANRFKLDWIRAQYAARMLAILEQLNGQPVQLELALAPRERSVQSPVVSIPREYLRRRGNCERCWSRSRRDERRKQLYLCRQVRV